MNEHETQLDSDILDHFRRRPQLDSDDLTHIRRLLALGNDLWNGRGDPELALEAARIRLHAFLRNLSADELDAAHEEVLFGVIGGGERNAAVPARHQQLVVLQHLLPPKGAEVELLPPCSDATHLVVALFCIGLWLSHTPGGGDGAVVVVPRIGTQAMPPFVVSFAEDFVDRRWLHPYSGRGQSSDNEYPRRTR